MDCYYANDWVIPVKTEVGGQARAYKTDAQRNSTHTIAYRSVCSVFFPPKSLKVLPSTLHMHILI